MQDTKILGLFEARNEEAIAMTDSKYGAPGRICARLNSEMTDLGAYVYSNTNPGDSLIFVTYDEFCNLTKQLTNGEYDAVNHHFDPASKNHLQMPLSE